MDQNPEEIQEIVKYNKKVSSLITILPLLLFILGLVIAAMKYKHTLA